MKNTKCFEKFALMVSIIMQEKKYYIYNCYMAKNEITAVNSLINHLFLSWSVGSTKTLCKKMKKGPTMQTKSSQHKSPDLQRALSRPFYFRKMVKKRAQSTQKMILFQKWKIVKNYRCNDPENTNITWSKILFADMRKGVRTNVTSSDSNTPIFFTWGK